MLQMSKRGWKWFFVGLLVLFPLVTGAQCGQLFNKATDKVNVPIPFKKSFEFEVDIDAAAAKAFKGKNLPDGKLPNGIKPIVVPVQQGKAVDISQEAAIKKHGSKLRYVDIKNISVSAVQNSANVDIPEVQIQMKKGGAADKDLQTIGTWKGIAAGKTGGAANIVSSSKKAYVSSLLLGFKFDIQAKTALTVKGGQSKPKGRIKLKIDLDLVFSVNPFK